MPKEESKVFQNHFYVDRFFSATADFFLLQRHYFLLCFHNFLLHIFNCRFRTQELYFIDRGSRLDPKFVDTRIQPLLLLCNGFVSFTPYSFDGRHQLIDMLLVVFDFVDEVGDRLLEFLLGHSEIVASLIAVVSRVVFSQFASARASEKGSFALGAHDHFPIREVGVARSLDDATHFLFLFDQDDLAIFLGDSQLPVVGGVEHFK